MQAFSFISINVLSVLPDLAVLAFTKYKTMAFRLSRILSAKKNTFQSLSTLNQATLKALTAPKGYFAVSVGLRDRKWFVIPTSLLKDPYYQVFESSWRWIWICSFSGRHHNLLLWRHLLWAHFFGRMKENIYHWAQLWQRWLKVHPRQLGCSHWFFVNAYP